MAFIAKVIVDVPVMQTNKPYDYLIPDSFVEALKPGMRVVVPFGRGGRKVQGFVVAISSSASYYGKMKEVSGIMDLDPVLTEELLELGKEMAFSTFSFQISCFQTMLPSVMRAKYQKYIRILEPASSLLRDEYANNAQLIPWQKAEEQGDLPYFMHLQKQGVVDVYYDVKDTRTKKKVRHLQILLSVSELKNEEALLGNRAPKQKELLGYLINHPDSLLGYQTVVSDGFSSGILREAEKKNWIQSVYIEEYRDPFEHQTFETSIPFQLNQEQKHAYEAINQSIEADEHRVFLLKGVTGSGKTEIYLQSIADVLKEGKSALMLVPEISLTPQMVSRFKGRFGEEVAVLHSALSEGEKYDEWRKIHQGEAKVVVGARSSVFAPVKKLGLVIIDEEHENSYKQEENPRYHARTVAIWRANYHNCPVILGSATPSLESRARATKNVYTLLELKERVNQAPLPPVAVIDMRKEAEVGNYSIFSAKLQAGIQERLDKNEQVILLLNRRGYSSFMLCRDCGFVLQCPNCDISLTLHKDTNSMKCHYCGHQERTPTQCPQCTSKSIRFFGTGTQKVEDELNQLYPDTKVIRMDVDTTRKKGSHQKLLAMFEKKEAHILLGTQMISKGLDFPEVTLVGVLNADTAMSLPDFRSSEKTFQLLTQVGGRAGRADLTGEVMIQTYNPEHYAIQLASTHDFDQFYLKEMSLRHLGNYPPYYYMIQLSVSHEKEVEAARKMAEFTDFIKDSMSSDAIVLGPSPKSLARTKNRYHYQTLIKYKHEPELIHKLHELLQKTQKEQAKGLYISIDPNPLQFY